MRIKPARVLRGEGLDDAIREVAQLFPQNVIYQGPLSEAARFVLGSKGQGRRTSIDLAEYPAKRAAAVRKLGPRASQRAIATELHVNEKTIRNYDRRFALGRATPLRNAPHG